MNNSPCLVVTADQSGYFAVAVTGNNGSAGVQVGVGATYGVSSTSTGGTAVFGQDTSSGAGVSGVSHSGFGVVGQSNTYVGGSFSGVTGINASGTSVYGVYATTSSNSGNAAIHGEVSGSNFSNGVEGVSHNSSASGILGSNTAGGWAGYFSGKVNVTGEIFVGSCSGCTSDVRLKKNVEPLTGALDQLLKLKGATFEWKEPSEHEHEAGRGLGTQTGFIAQDVEKVFPNWVKQDGFTAPDGEKYKTLDLRQIEALEVESIRTLKAENDLLKERVAALESARQPRLSGFNLNGGLGLAGLAIGLGLVISRRKREQRPSQV